METPPAPAAEPAGEVSPEAEAEAPAAPGPAPEPDAAEEEEVQGGEPEEVVVVQEVPEVAAPPPGDAEEDAEEEDAEEEDGEDGPLKALLQSLPAPAVQLMVELEERAAKAEQIAVVALKEREVHTLALQESQLKLKEYTVQMKSMEELLHKAIETSENVGAIAAHLKVVEGENDQLKEVCALAHQEIERLAAENVSQKEQLAQLAAGGGGPADLAALQGRLSDKARSVGVETLGWQQSAEFFKEHLMQQQDEIQKLADEVSHAVGRAADPPELEQYRAVLQELKAEVESERQVRQQAEQHATQTEEALQHLSSEFQSAVEQMGFLRDEIEKRPLQFQALAERLQDATEQLALERAAAAEQRARVADLERMNRKLAEEHGAAVTWATPNALVHKAVPAAAPNGVGPGGPSPPGSPPAAPRPAAADGGAAGAPPGEDEVPWRSISPQVTVAAAPPRAETPTSPYEIRDGFGGAGSAELAKRRYRSGSEAEDSEVAKVLGGFGAAAGDLLGPPSPAPESGRISVNAVELDATKQELESLKNWRENAVTMILDLQAQLAASKEETHLMSAVGADGEKRDEFLTLWRKMEEFYVKYKEAPEGEEGQAPGLPSHIKAQLGAVHAMRPFDGGKSAPSSQQPIPGRAVPPELPANPAALAIAANTSLQRPQTAPDSQHRQAPAGVLRDQAGPAGPFKPLDDPLDPVPGSPAPARLAWEPGASPAPAGARPATARGGARPRTAPPAAAKPRAGKARTAAAAGKPPLSRGSGRTSKAAKRPLSAGLDRRPRGSPDFMRPTSSSLRSAVAGAHAKPETVPEGLRAWKAQLRRSTVGQNRSLALGARQRSSPEGRLGRGRGRGGVGKRPKSALR